ncbi:TRAP transporter substrate-binding protein DctP [Salinicoccus halitifaciens]|uniref:TRAP-type mannitol/chloroaromatic compound transport system substrate-binding protein n=1 Tax=Salinicoccus halitifaciens TaxID=1073415 RepID=A0ABV2E9H8_9STAP|nr:TRAP transporter substrate-binding protein DctP [Salinicoccus halitifaciens]MCD2138206.1 TRAP transporter substrate-binding protein DctP [Salinicoccus halitifaciens]
MKRIFLSLSLLIVVITGACAPVQTIPEGEKEVYEWRLVTHQIEGTARYDGTIEPFIEAVSEITNGQLIIEPYGADVLFPNNDTFEMVQNGVVEMAAIYTGFWTGKDPVFNLAGGTIPGDPIRGFEEHFYRSERLEPITSKAYEQFGITNLGAFDYAPEEILISRVPIEGIEDFKGKNIRAAGVASSFYGELGASAISLSAPEIYTGLQLGTVDAAEFNDFLVNGEMGLDEVTRYVIEPALHVGPSTDKELIVNESAWEQLPEELKAAVYVARDKVRYESAIAYGVESQRAETEWRNNPDIEFIELPEEDIEEMRKIGFDYLLDQREESELSKEYIDEYAKVLNELGYDEEAKILGFSE